MHGLANEILRFLGVADLGNQILEFVGYVPGLVVFFVTISFSGVAMGRILERGGRLRGGAMPLCMCAHIALSMMCLAALFSATGGDSPPEPLVSGLYGGGEMAAAGAAA